MRLLINHLTRMQAGCICAAGIDLQSGLNVRPVGNRMLSSQLLPVMIVAGVGPKR